MWSLLCNIFPDKVIYCPNRYDYGKFWLVSHIVLYAIIVDCVRSHFCQHVSIFNLIHKVKINSKG